MAFSTKDSANLPSALAGGRRWIGPGTRYVLTKIATALGTLMFVFALNFFLFQILPGDPINLYSRGFDIDPARIRQLQEMLGLPLWDQFLNYLRDPLSLGAESFKYSAPVWEVIGPRIWPTLLLTVPGMILGALIGVWLGILSAWRRGERFDKITTNIALIAGAMPAFWFGMILLITFAVGSFGIPGFFPVGGVSTTGMDLGTPAGWLDLVWHYTLPVTTITVVSLVGYTLIMRASLINEMSEDYLQTARAKGLSDRQVRARHAVPNALLPTVTHIFLSLGFLIGGAVTIETVFSIPGVGSLTVSALQGPDIALLQALFLLFSFAVIVANLIADFLYAVLDPRVRT